MLDHYRVNRRWMSRKDALRNAFATWLLDAVTNRMAGRGDYPQWYLYLRVRWPR